MSSSHETLKLARGLSENDIATGLAEADESRKRRAGYNNWIGLPRALQRRLAARAAAGLSIDQSPRTGRRGAVAFASLAALATCGTAGAAAAEALLGHGSTVLSLSVLPSLGVSGLAFGILYRVERRAAKHPLSLTPMQRSVARGYLVSPPDLLFPADPGIETRLAALAGLALGQIPTKPTWKNSDPGHPRTDSPQIDLDSDMVEIYERACHIKQARELAGSNALPSSSDIDSAILALTEQVQELCAYAGAVASVERGLLEEHRRISQVDDARDDSVVSELLADITPGQTVSDEFRRSLRDFEQTRKP
jgi:hypothetical protein